MSGTETVFLRPLCPKSVPDTLSPRLGVLRVRPDGDFDPLTEGGQETEEAVDGVTCNPATDERRHLRLVEPEQLGGLRLRELLLGDDVPDASDEFGVCEG